MTAPADILAFAHLLRAHFGPGVRLKFWADDAGNSQGRDVPELRAARTAREFGIEAPTR